MKITFYGAAGGVTGTSYYIESEQSAIMIDCGIFQGGKSEELKNKKAPPVNYVTLSAIVLTHGHLDHCGRLPLVARKGFIGTIYATPATIDLVKLVLLDALKVQTNDLEKFNRRLLRSGRSPIVAAYDEKDVEAVIRRLKPIPYHQSFPVANGMEVIVEEAGHIMGSGSIKLIVKEGDKMKTVVFSGDLGPQQLPIVRDAEPFTDADMVIMESTYGDRDHKPLQETLDEAIAIIRHAIELKGKILVPSFAIGRTQDILYYMEQAFNKGGLPRFPIYIDSPMAIKATKIYMSHPELFDKEMNEFIAGGDILNDQRFVHPTPTPEESKRLNDVPGPCMIIAGSGMCTAGRITHHLRHNLWRPETSVLIVGYQAEGTLGRRLVDGARSVRIFGETVAVRAQIHKLGGFSAHAGQSDLLKWFNAMAPCRPKVVLTHGEDKARQVLSDIIFHRYGLRPVLPQYENMVEL